MNFTGIEKRISAHNNELSAHPVVRREDLLEHEETPPFRVCVIMSTYNGERFLKEQIESLLAQNISNVYILVRDDGSIDGTIKILEQYSKPGVLEWYAGNNLGPAQSFLELLQHTPDADYYAFCDQDDIWLPEKLMTAVALLDQSTKEIKCYFGAYKQIDSEGNEIVAAQVSLVPFLLPSALVYNIATGCTMVFSKVLRDRVNDYLPRKIFMHDWWVYLVCLVFHGDIIYDHHPYILYRQHSNNVLSAKMSFQKKINRKISLFQSKPGEFRRSDNARELLAAYGNMIKLDTKKTLMKMESYNENICTRIFFAFDNAYRCRRFVTDLSFVVDAIFGLL